MLKRHKDKARALRAACKGAAGQLQVVCRGSGMPGLSQALGFQPSAASPLMQEILCFC